MRGMPQDKIARARELRRDGSGAEHLCWYLLRERRLASVKPRRQHSIGPYFADFARVSRKLGIELDGEHHAFQKEEDQRRTDTMICADWRVLRFWANEMANPEGVWAESVY